MQVRVADAGRVYAHQRVKGPAYFWLGDFFDLRSLFELFDENCFHNLTPRADASFRGELNAAR
jgi:hypothetical protein